MLSALRQSPPPRPPRKALRAAEEGRSLPRERRAPARHLGPLGPPPLPTSSLRVSAPGVRALPESSRRGTETRREAPSGSATIRAIAPHKFPTPNRPRRLARIPPRATACRRQSPGTESPDSPWTQGRESAVDGGWSNPYPHPGSHVRCPTWRHIGQGPYSLYSLLTDKNVRHNQHHAQPRPSRQAAPDQLPA